MLGEEQARTIRILKDSPTERVNQSSPFGKNNHQTGSATRSRCFTASACSAARWSRSSAGVIRSFILRGTGSQA